MKEGKLPATRLASPSPSFLLSPRPSCAPHVPAPSPSSWCLRVFWGRKRLRVVKQHPVVRQRVNKMPVSSRLTAGAARRGHLAPASSRSTGGLPSPGPGGPSAAPAARGPLGARRPLRRGAAVPPAGQAGRGPAGPGRRHCPLRVSAPSGWLGNACQVPFTEKTRGLGGIYTIDLRSSTPELSSS